MTAPGGGGGGDAVDPRAGGGQHPEQPGWAAPWNSPAPPPPNYPPPPGYPAGDQPGYVADYPSYTPPFGYQQPPGHGAPPYPGGYYPQPGYQGEYWSPETAAPGTNGMAIASLIASFTGLLCCVGAIVGIVLGTIALDQIKRTRQDGYGMAVAGIVIGVAILVVTLIFLIFAVHSH
ncbi:hypothetical protein A5647_06135 [Mycobacterium sp. 1100029.7]|nr:hypothetical protein A5647_06135 [Mycobacterium sp. 1100029.7]